MKGIIIIAIILCFFMTPFVVTAVDMDFNIAISGSDVSLVKVYTDYTGITNNTISQYEQYVYSVGQDSFEYDSMGYIGDNHDVSVSTNLTGARSARSGIGGSDYIENVGMGEHNETHSCCVFGIQGSGHDLTATSIVEIQPTTLSQTYVIEARNGEAGVGYVKKTDNVTLKGRYGIRAKNATVIGQQTCTRYPAGPMDDSLKKRICPWGGDGKGYPIFSPRYGMVNES